MIAVVWKKRRFFDLYRNEFVTYTYSLSRKRVYYIFYFFLPLSFRCPTCAWCISRDIILIYYIYISYIYIIYISYILYIYMALWGVAANPHRRCGGGWCPEDDYARAGRGAPPPGRFVPGWDGRATTAEDWIVPFDLCEQPYIYTPARPSPWLRRARGCGRLSGFCCARTAPPPPLTYHSYSDNTAPAAAV